MNTEKIAAITENAIKSGEELGAAVVITKDGKNIVDFACGYADKELAKPMRADTLCRMFSCTKIITAISAMICIENGKFAMDDEICRFIPEFGNSVYWDNGELKPTSRRIKVSDLLNMTSGIAYPSGGKRVEKLSAVWRELEQSYRDGNMMSTIEFAKRIAKCPLTFDVGKNWMYGSSADIMGAIIETATGMEFRSFVKEKILSPLGMNDTDFFVSPEKRNRLAQIYERTEAGIVPFGGVNLAIFDFDKVPQFQSGGAGLFSTAEDYAKLGAAISCGGGGIIGRKTVDFLKVNALSDVQRKNFNWDNCRGCGYANFMRIIENRNSAGLFASNGAFGWDGWTGTYLLIDPSEHMSVTLALQRINAGTTGLAKAVVNAAYSEI